LNHSLADDPLDFPLRRHSDLLQKFPYGHVKAIFIHKALLWLSANLNGSRHCLDDTTARFGRACLPPNNAREHGGMQSIKIGSLALPRAIGIIVAGP
jgi:hypothetical protein